MFLTDLEGVHERLKERGANDDLCGYVEDLLMNQHQRYHKFMTAESDKRRLLLEHLQELEVPCSTYAHTVALCLLCTEG